MKEDEEKESSWLKIQDFILCHAMKYLWSYEVIYNKLLRTLKYSQLFYNQTCIKCCLDSITNVSSKRGLQKMKLFFKY